MSSQHCESHTEANCAIHDVLYLANDIASLFLQSELSDLTLIVQGRRFPVHRVILAARSQYFRALLYSGLKETFQNEIEMINAQHEAFEHVLRFIYKGTVNVAEMSDDLVMELLSLAHRYGLVSIEKQISSHLAQSLTLDNVGVVLNVAVLYFIRDLTDRCLRFIDKHSAEFLDNALYLNLSEGSLTKIIERDSFCASEIDIYSCVAQWLKVNEDKIDTEKVTLEVMPLVRLSLISIQDLMDVVRPAGLVIPDMILDAITSQLKGCLLPHRGLMIPEENLITIEAGAVVLQGSPEIMSGSNRHINCDQNDNIDTIFAEHIIDDQGRIIARLGRPSKVNMLRMHLYDNDNRSYSYMIEMSIDQQLWINVCDYRKYVCRSHQTLLFEAIVVRYIRIIGTRNTAGKTFTLMNLECLYTEKSFRSHNGLQIPDCNVASVERYANVIDGVSRNRNSLLNGPTKNYNWDSGYTCHQLGNGAIIVQLAQPYFVNNIRFLLWDLDDRSYSYTVEVSIDRSKWAMVADKSAELCSSHQNLYFESQPVVFIRIIGTHNTTNEVFHIVYLEAFCDMIEPAVDGLVQESGAFQT